MHRLLLGVLLFVLTFASACGSLEEAAERQDDDDFQRAFRSDRNYDIYWLGEEFEAGGLTAQDPDVDGIGGEIEGGGLGLTYLSSCEKRCVDLQIKMYSEEAWSLKEDRRSRIQKTNLESRSVTVAGVPATLVTHSGDSLPIAAQTLELKIGRTYIEAIAMASFPVTPNDPQPNPLIDEATFLAVMQNLRPYPE